MLTAPLQDGQLQFSMPDADLQAAAQRKLALEERKRRDKQRADEEAKADSMGTAVGGAAGTVFGVTPWGAATGGPAVWGPVGSAAGKIVGSLLG